MTPRCPSYAYPARVNPSPPIHPEPQSHRALPGPRRQEPGWGRVDQLDFHEVARDRRPLMPRARRLAWIVVVAMLILAAVLLRRPLADWIWPETRAQALREQAELALARGHLTAGDGSGARELYEAAIAIDPDRNEARTGLARVAQAALAQADAALRRDDFALAHRQLALARELQVPRASAEAVAARLRAREADVAGIEGLLAQAEVAREQGRLDGAGDAALPVYRRVLSLRPDNLRALEGREDALSELLQQARRALQSGQVGQAATMIAAARGYDPGHVDLPQRQGALTRAIEQLRQRADRDRRRGELQAAAGKYRQLLQIDAEDAVAARGMAAVAAAHAMRAERAAADFDFRGAEAALREARAIAPGSEAVERAANRIADARRTRARLLPPAASRRQASRVDTLLREAAQAEARGDLLTPPGDSAYDKLRAARALAPAHPGVARAQARLVPAAKQCFERELPRNDLGRARICLDAWIALEGEGSVTRQARRRLAQRWLAVGAERLGAGEVASAAAALRSAESIDRATPGIEDFRARLRAASASRD